MLELLKARGRLPAFAARVEVVVLIEDEQLRAGSLRLVQTLRDAGCAVEYALTPTRPNKQFKQAQELHANWTVKLVSETVVEVQHLNTRTKRSGPSAAVLHLLAET